MPTFQARVAEHAIEVRGPYAEKDRLKSIAGALWNPKAKCWSWPKTPAAAATLSEQLYPELENDLAFHELVRQDAARAVAMSVLGKPVFRISPENSKGGLWEHQTDAFNLALASSATMLAMDMGTGKSRIAVELFNHTTMMLILIICPKSVMRIWPKQFELWAGKPVDVVVLDQKPMTKRIVTAQLAIDVAKAKGRAVAFIINHEAAWREKFAELALEIDWDLVVWDESHRGKDAVGKLSLFMQQLSRVATRRLCLTGTPMPHSPLDIFSQYRFLDAGIFGSTYGPFKRRYDAEADASASNPIRRHRYGARLSLEQVGEKIDVKSKIVLLWEIGKMEVWAAKIGALAHCFGMPSANLEQEILDWKIGHGNHAAVINEDELNSKFFSIAYRVKADDVLDLPEYHYITQPVTLDKKTRAAYDDIENDYYAKLEEGEVAPSNALAQSIRLRQVCSGHIRNEEGALLEMGDHKIDALRGILSDVDEPVVVFVTFRPDLDAVGAICAELDLRYGELSGKQNDLTEDALMPEDIDVLGVMIQSGGVGIDLTRASLAVYFSCDWSLANWLQSQKRLHRPGQDRATRFITLETEGTIEGRVYEALRRREDVVESVLMRGKE
jgi:SNF2 family DNA or RNA helicase|tara:strand:- start:7565 stop:9403 length:1839 start_codon:yes stop_codon:yes gene_type:complete